MWTVASFPWMWALNKDLYYQREGQDFFTVLSCIIQGKPAELGLN